MNKKIRILHVGLDTHLGGIETYLMKITTHVDKSKYQFDFLMYDNKKPCFYDELTALGCKFYNVTGRRKSFHKNHQELKALFSTGKFDVIYCHLNSLSYITPAMVALECGLKVVVQSHNAGALTSALSRILHKINYYRLPKNKIVCAAVSDLAGEWMFGEKTSVTILNNGLDTEKYRFSQIAREKIRKEFDLGEKEVILHTGAFRTQKNHDFLIDIFNRYVQQNKDSVLMLVGEGELMPAIKQKVEQYQLSDKVIFAGLRRDIPAILSAADKYLFPSFYEGFPNALIEAEAAGLYCVAADTITKQAKVDSICQYVSLKAPLDDWVRALEHASVSNRKTCAQSVEDLGLGIGSEMNRLYLLYKRSGVNV